MINPLGGSIVYVCAWEYGWVGVCVCVCVRVCVCAGGGEGKGQAYKMHG